MSADTHMIGQTLAPSEPPATASRTLAAPQRRALRLCLSGPGRLDFAGPLGWRHPISTAVFVNNRTITALARAGLIAIVKRSRFNQHARLTRRGDWYARTIVTEHIAAAQSALRAAA